MSLKKSLENNIQAHSEANKRPKQEKSCDQDKYPRRSKSLGEALKEKFQPVMKIILCHCCAHLNCGVESFKTQKDQREHLMKEHSCTDSLTQTAESL